MAPRAVGLFRLRGAGALLVLSVVSAAGAAGWLVAPAGRPSGVHDVGRLDPPASTIPAADQAAPTTVAAPPPPPAFSQVATASVHALPVYAAPGAPTAEMVLDNPNSLGAPLTLLVTAVSGSWVQTYLPVRPNEAQGWVPAADVTLTNDPYRITISLAARQLTLYQGGSDLVLQVPVAVGSPDSPTPLGHFFVADVLKLTDPQNAYGPYALGLSGFSNTYYSFDGGPGQIAVHGTNQPWVIGGYASHGCVRLANPDITRLAQIVPAGTPVDVGL